MMANSAAHAVMRCDVMDVGVREECKAAPLNHSDAHRLSATRNTIPSGSDMAQLSDSANCPPRYNQALSGGLAGYCRHNQGRHLFGAWHTRLAWYAIRALLMLVLHRCCELQTHDL